MKIIESFLRSILIFTCFLVSAAIFVNEAFACSCYPTKTVDKEFAESDKVVILKLQSINQNEGEAVKYQLSVEKVFKGNLKTGDILPFTLSSNCSWMFLETDVGTEFLFYLGAKPEKGENWVGSICSRSGRVKDRTDDLLYLEKEPQLRGKTRLSGKLEQLDSTSEEMCKFSFSPLAGKKIRITGNGKNIELDTDQNGVYEIYDLPAGTYKISPEKIYGYQFGYDYSTFAEVKINTKSQTEQNFIYSINNAISGRIFDSNGAPLKNVCLDLVPSRPAKPIEKQVDWFKYHCTNKNGFFEINSIPEGTYYLVINKEGVAMTSQYFETFYYPSARTPQDALEITVGKNYFLRNLRIVPPEKLETVTLSGTLLFNDGNPAVGERIIFLNDAEISRNDKSFVANFETKTDQLGRFSLKVQKGQKGIIRGILVSSIGVYKNCPERDDAIKQKGKSPTRIDYADQNSDATGNLSGIELNFSMPSCKEEKWVVNKK